MIKSSEINHAGNHILPGWRPRVDATPSTTNKAPEKRMSLQELSSSSNIDPGPTQKDLPGCAIILQGHVSSDCDQFSFRHAYDFRFQSQNQDKSTVSVFWMLYTTLLCYAAIWLHHWNNSETITISVDSVDREMIQFFEMYSDMSKLTKHKSETNHSVTNQNQVAWRIQFHHACALSSFESVFPHFPPVRWFALNNWVMGHSWSSWWWACLGFPKFHAPIFFWFACATLRLFDQKMFFFSSATANFPTVTWKLASDLGRMALAIIPRSWTRARRRIHEATVSNCLIFGCQAFWPKTAQQSSRSAQAKSKNERPWKWNPNIVNQSAPEVRAPWWCSHALLRDAPAGHTPHEATVLDARACLRNAGFWRVDGQGFLFERKDKDMHFWNFNVINMYISLRAGLLTTMWGWAVKHLGPKWP